MGRNTWAIKAGAREVWENLRKFGTSRTRHYAKKASGYYSCSVSPGFIDCRGRRGGWGLSLQSIIARTVHVNAYDVCVCGIVRTGIGPQPYAVNVPLHAAQALIIFCANYVSPLTSTYPMRAICAARRSRCAYYEHGDTGSIRDGMQMVRTVASSSQHISVIDAWTW